MSIRHRISSPLEAGTSVMDVHQLPAPVTAALEYASRRLCRRKLRLTLVVARREYQVPAGVTSPSLAAAAARSATVPPPSASSSTSSSPLASPVPSLSSSASTPLLPTFAASPIRAFKQLVSRSNTLMHAGSHAPVEIKAPLQLDPLRSNTVSPTCADFSSACTSPRRAAWPLSPLSPATVPMTPATPATSNSTATTDTSYASSVSAGFQAVSGFGIRLVQAAPLDTKDQRALEQAVDRARRKFHIGSDLLSGPFPPVGSGLSAEVLRRSTAQNDVVFESECLTLVSLDRLYSFKCALAAYARTQSPCLLEDAVDELRRLILAGGRQPLRKSRLVGGYGGAVNESALSDVSRMYRRAYGGPDGDAGIENDLDADLNVRRPAEHHYHDHDHDHDHQNASEPEAMEENRGASPGAETARLSPVTVSGDDSAKTAETEAQRTTPRLVRPTPSPRLPALKLCTTFDNAPRSTSAQTRRKPVADAVVNDEQQKPEQQAQPVEQMAITLEVEDPDEDGDLTARPSASQQGSPFSFLFNNVSIAEVLHNVPPTPITPHDAVSPGAKLGPATPHGYDDISPVTRGEWSFFMKSDGLGLGKTVTVETC